jgi:hypothetical protein
MAGVLHAPQKTDLENKAAKEDQQQRLLLPRGAVAAGRR